MTIKAILFDLDGTLINTTNLIIKSFQHTIRVHYNKEVDVNDVIAYFGKPLREAMEYLGADKVDELISTYREFNHKYHDELTTEYEGVKDTIQTLFNDGIKLAVVTSKMSTTARRGLRLFNMDKFFTVIIGVDECTMHKPHPEPVLNAMKRLNVKSQDCLMIGDSPFDLISAKKAGVKTAAVRWTEVPWEQILAEKPDYVLDTMKDLLNIVNGEK